jgi:site-specific DNA-adenine methylase
MLAKSRFTQEEGHARYPGGKGGAGVYQTIINNIPPHDTYIETHLGGGNILSASALLRAASASTLIPR